MDLKQIVDELVKDRGPQRTWREAEAERKRQARMLSSTMRYLGRLYTLQTRPGVTRFKG